MEFGNITRSVNPDTNFVTFTVEVDDPVQLSAMVRQALPEDTLNGTWGGGRGKYYFTVADVEVARERLRRRGQCDELDALAALLPVE